MADEHETLEPHPDGFRTRLRYGKGLRGRFVIKLRDETEALRRERKLRDLAGMLASAGLTAEAPIILKHAAAVQSERDFEEMVRMAEARCVGTGKVKRSTLTFRQLGERWTDGTLAKDHPDHVNAKKTADLDESRLKVIYAVPVAPGLSFGALPIDSVKLHYAEAVMAALPKRAKKSATRRHYAQLIHRVLELAVYPCKLIAANPLPKSFMPKIGKPPAFSYLYPDEDAALLKCQKDEVPLCYRVLWGFLAREGCRTSEAAAMRLGHELDLERGVCSLDENKTDDARAWALDKGVARALAAYAEIRGIKKGQLVFTDEAGEALQDDKLAELVRDHLSEAGVDREELHTSTENRGRFRAHDLRGTFVTLSLAAGRSEAWVQDRTGHTTSVMLNRYRRAARSASELDLGPLLPLDRAIPELAAVAAQGGPEGGPAEPVAESKKSTEQQKTSSRVDSSVRLEQRIFKTDSTDPDEQPSVKTDPSCTVERTEEHGGPPETTGVGQGDPVEEALAEGLRRAAAAGAWEAVQALTAELRARREARVGVVSLEAERARRVGGGVISPGRDQR